MTDPYRAERQALIAAVTEGRGHLAPDVRAAIVDRGRGREADGRIPEPLPAFVDRVARDATLIRDDDLDALAADGLDDDAVFEAVIAAALGASLARLERVDQLLSPEA